MTTRRYAQGTKVPIDDQSRLEIERYLRARGADEFGSGYTTESAMVAFKMRGQRVKLTIARTRTERGRVVQIDQNEERRRWRSVLLVVKSKIASVDSGIETFEQAWLPYLVRSDGATVYEDLQRFGLGNYLDNASRLLGPGDSP
jgi:hypothetical protein